MAVETHPLPRGSIGPGLVSAKLLLADDDQDLVDLLSFALRRDGFETVAAHDAATAREIVERDAPDLVVLDLDLGTGAGFELLKELRHQTRSPVIVITPPADRAGGATGLALGADDYVTKPFSYPALIERIRASLRRAGSESAAVRAP